MPAGPELRAQTAPFLIKVDGAALEANEIAQVVDLTIEQDLVLPDSFAIRLRDIEDSSQPQEHKHLQLLNSDRFKVGASIQIALGHEEDPRPVLKGEITSLDFEIQDDTGPILSVRGYDGSHRLHRERKSRTFKNVSDSDLASKIARDHGLTPQTDATREVHEHVYQDNQTDWEFLRARANRVGFELFVRDGKLYFCKPQPSGQSPEQELGKTLFRLRMRLSAPSQVEEVLVTGWDPATKREIVGRATRPSVRARIGESRTGGQMAQRLGTGKFVLAEQPVRSQREADALAQSVFDDIVGEFIQLEGTIAGEPDLRPGQPIKLKNLGNRFDGEYYLSATTHRVTARDGYLTHITVSGRRPMTLSALLDGRSAGSRGPATSHPGVVIGLVTNNRDTERGGRVKVQFPWLGKDESHWARVATPMAGDGRGFYYLPEVGDEAVVAFEHGDVNHPYVIGYVWNGRDKPPKSAAAVVGPTGKVNQRIIRSRLGHVITLDDSDESPNVTIEDKSGNIIKMDSLMNKLTVNFKGAIEIEAKTTVTIKGAMVDIEASGPMTLRGAIININ